MENCFLSIVVPVYNGERYLAGTLDALLAQDITNYEILCINDGSSDGTAGILDGYARQHQNIRVYHQSNAGVAAARNAGIDHARGEFLWFVDADDLIAPNMLSRCQTLVMGTDCQRLSFGGYTFTGELTGQEVLTCNVPWQDSVVWRNWLRTDFLREQGLRFRYPEITHGEDGLFMFEVSRACPKTLDIPDILYFYRVHPNSAENRPGLANRRRQLASHLRVVEVVNGYYRRDHSEAAANRLVTALWYTLYQAASMPKEDARAALDKLKSLNLYPIQMPGEATVGKTYLVDDSGTAGKVLEFFCRHLHRQWGYAVLRVAHQVKNRIR